MIKLSNEYVAFGALMLITCTGLAMVVVGSCLLSWAAYLSPWMPTWVWVSISAFNFLGVGVAATSAVTAIATVAPKPKAAHMCLMLLLVFLGTELFVSALGAVSQPHWSSRLYHEVHDTMLDSMMIYSTNDSSAAMWNEIQNEMSCCGVRDYTDWFSSEYSNDDSVPDSCCLLPSPGCGLNIKHLIDIDDTIDTQGCLPVLSAGWLSTYQILTRQALLPICALQVVLVLVIVLTYRRAGLLHGHLPLLLAAPTVAVVEEHGWRKPGYLQLA